jgi:SNF2 family DNA or RNA helicase
MTIKARNSSIHSFINDPKIKVLLSTTGAGGLGLNLTVANRVIFIEPQWTFCITKQAECRVYRIGQEKEVYVHHLVVKNGVDDWVYKTGIKKMEDCMKWLDGNYDISGKTEELTAAFRLWVYGNNNIPHYTWFYMCRPGR